MKGDLFRRERVEDDTVPYQFETLSEAGIILRLHEHGSAHFLWRAVPGRSLQRGSIHGSRLWRSGHMDRRKQHPRNTNTGCAGDLDVRYWRTWFIGWRQKQSATA
jgi:hypothetical protein